MNPFILCITHLLDEHAVEMSMLFRRKLSLNFELAKRPSATQMLKGTHDQQLSAVKNMMMGRCMPG